MQYESKFLNAKQDRANTYSLFLFAYFNKTVRTLLVEK